jgi:hypothetical protein
VEAITSGLGGESEAFDFLFRSARHDGNQPFARYNSAIFFAMPS